MIRGRFDVCHRSSTVRGCRQYGRQPHLSVDWRIQQSHVYLHILRVLDSLSNSHFVNFKRQNMRCVLENYFLFDELKCDLSTWSWRNLTLRGFTRKIFAEIKPCWLRFNDLIIIISGSWCTLFVDNHKNTYFIYDLFIQTYCIISLI